jgi:SAM-dependent methyltransferase
MKLCRLCGSDLLPSPVIRLEGMPLAAQYFPPRDEFARDQGITLVVRQCSGCGLVQLDGEPVGYFREVITAASLSEKGRSSRLESMRRFAVKFELSGKRVLEVGCGQGEMLDVLAQAGLSATGIEAAAGSVALGQAKGRDMVHGYIGDVDAIRGAPFDAFVSLNYLEHLPDPGRIIRKIHGQTGPQAAGYVTVPNLEYLLSTRCLYEFVADHLCYFTRKTLTHAFESNGFDVLACEPINEDNDIEVMVKKRGALDVSPQFGEVEALLEDLRQLIAERRSRGQKVAVWGAGHRTLALLSLGGLKDVAFVVDSAKFKQGLFTPVLHLEISSPERLKTERVGLVLVMVPGLYPREVTETLARMDVGAEVAVLRGNRVEFLPEFGKGDR